jgi:plastocyanin
MRRRLAIVLACAVAVLSAGIVALTTSSASAASHTIVIKNTTFTPATLNVAVGDTVTWVNQETDNTTHSIRGPWTSPDIPPGGSYTVTITAAGTYDYFCGFHPFMTGTIVAGGTGGTTTTPTTTTTTTTRPPTTTTTTPTTTTSGGTTPPTTTTTTSGSSGNPPLGADQGDGTKLATFTTASDGYKEFRLRMAPIQWTVEPGVVKSAYAFNGIIPGPTIKVNEGDKVRIIVQNDLPEHSAVHWHGMVLDNSMDGVPDLTQPHILPGESFTYQYTAVATGTHWYHSHTGGGQVGKGLYGALLVTPSTGDIAATRHYTQEIGDGANGFTVYGKSYPATTPLTA